MAAMASVLLQTSQLGAHPKRRLRGAEFGVDNMLWFLLSHSSETWVRASIKSPATSKFFQLGRARLEGSQWGVTQFSESGGACFAFFFVHDVGGGRRMVAPVNGVDPRLDEGGWVV